MLNLIVDVTPFTEGPAGPPSKIAAPPQNVLTKNLSESLILSFYLFLYIFRFGDSHIGGGGGDLAPL